MNLASFPTPGTGAFSIGSLTIHYYGVIIAIGIVLACWVTGVRLKHRGADGWAVLDVALWAVPFGIIGGRLYHVFTHPADYFTGTGDPLRFLYIWEGGLAIFGALLLGVVGAVIGTHLAGLRLTTLLDAAAPGILLAQALGRWGNYFNNELFGTPTNLPWGIQIPAGNSAFPVGLPEGTLFHPAFLYESMWNLIGVLVLLWAGRRFALQWGRLFGLYLVWYGIGRFFVEGMRLDPIAVFLGARLNQWGAVAVVVIGLVIMFVQARRHPGAEPSPYRPEHLARLEALEQVAVSSAAVDADSADAEVASAADSKASERS
ncbi:prolipoprotein diacylglyceryl transferase [Pseudoclavibacter sp. CFCC 11306]|uniref:prolipoprotein diacylglyceryl transferase n=1 Tax=Pseudoclavibacter sp. CFCC 11306 TaxID=1564493 RepID=UPI0013011198|nr:prolipoprotein diacylglyceryl transferase [Pseudoclavibacter sp. CFCC 11306]KAB1658261.1 prolipoprotein diacylglyceryl transferase [Pseudoclavibacter sp. CFCC 11306]